MKSLIVGVAREPGRTAELAAATRRRLLVIFLPLLALGCLIAGPALGLVFGPEYAAAADVLRLLLVGLALRLIVLIELGVRQALGRARGVRPPAAAELRHRGGRGGLVPVGASDVGALAPVAAAYIAVQLACAVVALRANQPHGGSRGHGLARSPVGLMAYQALSRPLPYVVARPPSSPVCR